MLFSFQLIQFFSLLCLRIFSFSPIFRAESKEDMTSLPTTPSAQHQFASSTQMEQKQLLPDRNTESSRLPPDGREFPVKRLMNGFSEKQQTKRLEDLFFIVLFACGV